MALIIRHFRLFIKHILFDFLTQVATLTNPATAQINNLLPRVPLIIAGCRAVFGRFATPRNFSNCNLFRISNAISRGP